MAEKNLKSLYNNIRNKNRRFTKTYESFKEDMQDENNRKRLWGNLPKMFNGFNKSYDEFSSDISVDVDQLSKQQEDVEEILAAIQANEGKVQKPVQEEKHAGTTMPISELGGMQSVSDHSIEKPREVIEMERQEQESERARQQEEELRNKFVKKQPVSTATNPMKGIAGIRAEMSKQEPVHVPTIEEMRPLIQEKKKLEGKKNLTEEEKARLSEIDGVIGQRQQFFNKWTKTETDYAQEVYDRRYKNPEGSYKDSFAKDLFDNAMAGIGEIALTPYRAVEAAENFGMDIENAVRGTNFQHGSGTATQFLNKVFGGDYLRARVEHYKKEGDRYQDGIGITESMLSGNAYSRDFSKGLGKAILSTVQSAPNLAVSIYAGKKGLETLGGSFLGATAALQKYDEVKDDDRLDTTEKAGVMFTAFVAECVPEIIGAKRYGRMFNKQTVGSVRKETQQEVTSAWNKFLDSDFMRANGNLWNKFMETFGEGTTEAMTDVINLIVDMSLGIKDGVTGQDILSIGDSFIVGQLSDAIPSGVHVYQQNQFKNEVKKEIAANPILQFVARQQNSNVDEMADIAAKRAFQETMSEKEEKVFDAYVDAVGKRSAQTANITTVVGEAGLPMSADTYDIYSQAIEVTGKTEEEVDKIMQKDADEMTKDDIAYLSTLSDMMKQVATAENVPVETPAEQEEQHPEDLPHKEVLSTGTKPLEFKVQLVTESRESGKTSDITENLDVSFRSNAYTTDDDGAIVSDTYTLVVNGKPVSGKRKQQIMDAINNQLRDEKTASDAEAERLRQEEERKQTEEYQREQDQKQMQEQLNQQKAAVRESIPVKNGRIDTDKATPEQIVFNASYKNQNGEEVTSAEQQAHAVQTAYADIVFFQQKKEETSKKTGVRPSQIEADMAYYDDLIAQYRQALQKWIGPEAVEQLDAMLTPEAAHAETNVPVQPEQNPAKRAKKEQPAQQQAEQAPVQEHVQETPVEKPVTETKPVQEKPAEKSDKLTARSDEVYDHIKVETTKNENTGLTDYVYIPYVKAEDGQEPQPVKLAGKFINRNIITGGAAKEFIDEHPNDIRDIQVTNAHETSEKDIFVANVIITTKDGQSAGYLAMLNTLPKVGSTKREKQAEVPKEQATKAKKAEPTDANPFEEDVVLVQHNGGKVEFVTREEMKDGDKEIAKRTVYVIEGGELVPYSIRSAKQTFGANSAVAVVGADGVRKSIYANQLFVDDKGTPFVGSEYTGKRQGKLKVNNLQDVVNYPVYRSADGTEYTLSDLLTTHEKTVRDEDGKSKKKEFTGYDYVRQKVDAENPNNPAAIERFNNEVREVVKRWNALADTLLESRGHDAAKLLAYRYAMYRDARRTSIENGRYDEAHRIDDRMVGDINFKVGDGFDARNLSVVGLNNPLMRVGCMIEITKNMPDVKSAEFDVELPNSISKLLDAKIVTAKEISAKRSEYKNAKSTGEKLRLEEEYPEVKNTWVPLTREAGTEGYNKVKPLLKLEAGETKSARKLSKEKQELDSFRDLCQQAFDALKAGDSKLFAKLNDQISKKVGEHAEDKINKFKNQMVSFQNTIKAIMGVAYPDVAKLATLHNRLDNTLAIVAKRNERVETLQNQLNSVNAQLDSLYALKVDTEGTDKMSEEVTAKKERLEEKLADAIAEAERPMANNPDKLRAALNEAIAANPKAEELYQEMTKQVFPENGLHIEFQMGDDVMEGTSPQARLATSVLQTLLNNVKGAYVHYMTSRDELEEIVSMYGFLPELMGSRLDNRKEDIHTKLLDYDLDKVQSDIVDVFVGNKNNATVVIGGRKIKMRKGKAETAGTEHSIFRHYQTKSGWFNAGEVALIPTIIEKGTVTEKVEDGRKKFEYKWQFETESPMSTDPVGVTFTVITEVQDGVEAFDNFYSNRKIAPTSSKTHSEEALDVAETIETGRKGTTISSNTQEKSEKNEEIDLLRLPDGKIYGCRIGEDVYITPDGMNPETIVHEYTHLWLADMKGRDKKEYNRILAEVEKCKPFWEKVTKEYKHLKTKDAIASEVLARYSGKHGGQRMVDEAVEIYGKNKNGEPTALAKALINRMKKVLADFWGRVKETFHIKTIGDISDWVLKDLIDGKPLNILSDDMIAIKDKAIADGTFMTYNGNPTKLTEKQWLQVRTQAFIDWYGDWMNPKEGEHFLLDENGEPMVVYHGTDHAGFDIMDPKDYDIVNGEETHTSNGRAIFLTPQKFVAGVYAGLTGEDVNENEALIGDDPRRGIYSLFAKANNPLVVDCTDGEGNPSMWSAIPTGNWKVVGPNMSTQYFNTEEEANEWMYENGYGIDTEGTDLEEPEVMPNTMTTDEFVDLARKQVYDSVIFKNIIDGTDSPLLNDLNENSLFMQGHDVIAVIEPNQVKSATQNRGLFSMQDDRIEYQYAESELTQLDEPTEERIRKEEDKGTEKMLNPDSSDQERESFWESVATRIADQSNGMRLMLNSINAYRKMNGQEPLDGDKYDVRTKFEACRSIIANKIGFLERGEQKELDDYIRDFAKTVENSQFYQDHMKEVGGKNPATLTPVQLIERYLIARNNWERAKEGVPRGLAEFKERMGMGVIEFSNAFTEAYGEKAVLDLWEKIRKMTDFALDTNFEGGMISEELYNSLKAKKFYVPQRGFWDDVNPENEENEKEDLLQRRQRGNNVSRNKLDSMHKAEGGNSLAEGCLAYIARDARQAIKLSEENKVKKVMFDLLRDNADWCHEPEHGFKVPRQAYYTTNEEGKIVRIDDGPTDEQKQEMRQLQNIVRQLKEQFRNAKTDEEREAIQEEIYATEEQYPYFDEKDSYRILHSRVADQYEKGQRKNAAKAKALVGLYVNGVPCEIEMTPRFISTADALNGRRDTRGELSNVKTVTSWFSAQYTMNNPTFFAVNITRDTPLILTKGTVEYGPEFSARFTANWAVSQKAIWKYLVTGEIDNTDVGAQLLDFLNHGGNTGYSNLEELQRWRNRVADLNPGGLKYLQRELSSVDGAQKVGKALLMGGKGLVKFGDKCITIAELRPLAQVLNEWSEIISRFSAYKAVVDMGRGVNEGVKAAHNLSTNFNRKGLGHPFINLFNTLSVFANASIQGASGYWRTLDARGGSGAKAKKIAKTAAVMGMLPSLLGFLCTMLNPDDDEYEYAVGDYTRDNYVILGDMKFALNEQLKPWWVIGVNAAQVMRGRRTMRQACNSVLTSIVTNWVPLPQNITAPMSMVIENKFGGQQNNAGQIFRQAITPSFMQTLNQWADNKNFMGGKLRYDLGDIPEYQMAPNEAVLYQDMAKLFYKWGGGNQLVPTKTKENGELLSRRADVNPKEIRANMFWVPSGVMDNFCLAYGIYKDAKEIVKGDFDETNIRVKDLPIINRFYSPSDNSLYRYGIVRETRDIVKRHKDRIKNYNGQVIHFADTNNEEAEKEAKRLLRAEMKDVKLTKLTEILDVYNDVSLQHFQKTMSESKKEFKSEHGAAVNKIDVSEKKLVKLMSVGVNLKNGLRRSDENQGAFIKFFDDISPARDARRKAIEREVDAKIDLYLKARESGDEEARKQMQRDLYELRKSFPDINDRVLDAIAEE